MDISTFVKIVVIILLALYSIFAFVVFIQVRVMNRVVNHTFFASLLSLVSLLFLTLGLLLFAAGPTLSGWWKDWSRAAARSTVSTISTHALRMPSLSA